MPYSKTKKEQIKLERKINSIRKRYYNELGKCKTEVISKAEKETMREANRMFKKYIHDYYLYPTKKYIRHQQEVPGTQTGKNLYLANNILQSSIDDLFAPISKKNTENFISDSVNADRMENYPVHGKYWTKKRILNAILKGYHWKGRKRWSPVEWEYSSDYFDIADISWGEVLKKLSDASFSEDLVGKLTEQEIVRKKYPLLKYIYEWGE